MTQLICDLYGITKSQLVGRCRKREFVEARQLHWLILKTQRNRLKYIGSIYGRSHSTVHSGIKRIKGVIETDKETRSIYQKVTEVLKVQSNFTP